ncbi:alpha/beta hydrolase [Microbacterium aoyamense]|uniref:Alpha/beta hydrolase n=1 Tax=Microbacterium aoyamense TaxID=344166 RepID=A0ABP5B9H9_9MICO|nr:alpha/beta fold hydrolase [Microbacterium aoyamense]
MDIDVAVEGSGTPALVLHGAYSTRDEVMPVLGPLLTARGMRGVYPDLPGMGESTDSSARSSDEVLDGLDAVIAAHIGDDPFVVIGHSFGGHLARGVAARHPDRVIGLALVSPLVDDFEPAPERVVEDDGRVDDLDEAVRDDFTGYFVVRNARTREAFENAVRPALGRYDGDVVEAIMTASTLTPDPGDVPFPRPVVVLLGRDDAFIGWKAQLRLMDAYPRATVVLADGAGHALLHERPALVRTALEDWLDRVSA